jgi:hypothetical protein
MIDRIIATQERCLDKTIDIANLRVRSEEIKLRALKLLKASIPNLTPKQYAEELRKIEGRG